ncbi:MAG: glucose-6-phosphate dehydrogenase assembly protein OpcA [Planctomycetota bacterium]|nr:glucose-6-phosphate dehydrogenase assembly protein OpcA [Planctomycetota bacterium]MDA0931896.1 glucose-6-phosphate dehydrogenase assembly protein OpcA [Planctomycetota bacterium]MDA1220553.1 glucose-6-phosphate dehydrogenase assembly protein OpcA [Planctomycetota bacterium]
MQEIVEREHPIAIQDLERCVRQAWEDEDVDDERPLYRALTMNLITVAAADDESLLRATFHRVLRTHPCLGFLVLLAPREVPFSASFATHVRKSRKSRTVLLELVTLLTSQADQRRVPSVIRPLLLDDLPTQLFWCGSAPRDLGMLRALGGLADQIVYDSALFRDPAGDTQRIEALGLPTMDLTSLRVRPWRRALAEAFEHVEWRDGMEVRARIRDTAAAGTRAASVHLAKWLETRLGASVEIEGAPRGNAPSFEPCTLEVTCGDAHVRVDHLWPQSDLKVSTTLRDRCLMPFSAVSRCDARGDLLASAAAGMEGARAAPGRNDLLRR